MPCLGCNSSPVQSFASFFSNSPCIESASNCGCNSLSSACVQYTGPNLPCSGIETADSIEMALQKLDEQICAVQGDYTTYSMHCLPTWYGVAITTQAAFVDAITGYACEIASDLATFINSTYVADQAEVDGRLDALEIPEVTCGSASVLPTDTLYQILGKYCVKFEDIDTALDISGVVYNNCLTVITPPTTIGEALQLLADQICLVADDTAALPTFNNIGTCLPAPLTSSDTLVATVNKIIARLCDSPTWDASNLTWGCIGAPGSNTDLEEAVQNIITVVNVHTAAFPTFDGSDFVVTPTSGDPCDGVTISLATPINQDRFVAANALDSSPSTLINKLVGVGLTVDDTTNAGKITLTVTGGAETYTVKADSTDTSPDYLINKVNGSTASGITLGTSYNSGSEQVDFGLSVNLVTLFDELLDELTEGSALYAKFCAKVAGCPSPCDPPTNVQAVAGISPTTSTTTLLP